MHHDGRLTKLQRCPNDDEIDAVLKDADRTMKHGLVQYGNYSDPRRLAMAHVLLSEHERRLQAEAALHKALERVRRKKGTGA